MSQKTKYFINTVLWTLVSTVISGSMLQTFLLEKGMTEDKVGTFVSALQFVQMAVIFLFSRFADTVRPVIRLTAFSHLLYLPFMFICAYMSFTDKGSLLPLLVFGVVACIASGLYNVLSYQLPYHVMDMKNYGRWTGESSVLSGIFMLLLTVSLSVLQKKFDYFPVMRFFYPFAFICTVCFFFATFSYKETGLYDKPKQTDEEKISILRYKPFTLLILPNLMRGFCAGIVSMAVTIGYFDNRLDAQSAAVLLVITQSVGIPANFVYTKLTGREPLLLLVSGFGILVSLSLIGLFDSVGFLILYGIAYFCICIVNISVPVLVTRIADFRIIGQYNGWRMLLNTAGIFLADFLCVPMMRTLGVVPTWILAGVLQMMSGLAYFLYCKKHRETISV